MIKPYKDELLWMVSEVERLTAMGRYDDQQYLDAKHEISDLMTERCKREPTKRTNENPAN